MLHAFFILASLTPLIAARVPCHADAALHKNGSVSNWLYTSQIDNQTLTLLDRPDINGVQSLYTWRSLEQNQGKYDFSAIHSDLRAVKAKGKKLWVQLQDRTFSVKDNPVPNYLHKPIYDNGSVRSCDGTNCDADFQSGGWTTAQWNKNVRRRFQALLKAMSESLDGHIYGMNFPETSIAVKFGPNYTCQDYFDGELDNAGYAASVFHKSFVVQYVNFWCDEQKREQDRSESFAFFAEHGVGIGGPDDIPYRPYQMENSYPYFAKYRNKVPISVIAVQEPDLAAINPNTSKPFTKQEFTDFAVDYLGVEIMFWATSSPWLQE